MVQAAVVSWGWPTRAHAAWYGGDAPIETLAARCFDRSELGKMIDDRYRRLVDRTDRRPREVQEELAYREIDDEGNWVRKVREWE